MAFAAMTALEALARDAIEAWDGRLELDLFATDDPAAANLAMVAYGARCQHSDVYLQPEFGDTSAIGWLRLLRDRGDRCFA